MGILRTAVKSSYIHLGGGQGYSVPPNESVIYRSDWEPQTSAIGRSVTAESAMSFVPFFAGVKLLSVSVGRTPLVVYERIGEDDRKRARDKQLYRILHDEPNPAMSAMVWKEAMQGHLVTRGNCYSERVRDDLGRDAELWPLRPDRMQVLRDSETGRKFYRYRIESLGDIVDLQPDQVFHIPAFGFDGYVGYSIVSLFRQAIALGLAAEEFGARFFRSGAQPASVVTVPAAWSEDKYNEFKTKLRANHEGLTNAQRIAVIEEGVTWETVGMNLDDAQFLETRKFQRGEIATMLGLPPHMIGDLEHATFTNIEEQGLNLIAYSFGEWFDRWAQETNRQLVRPAYGQRMYAEHLVEHLLKGKAEDRAKFYQFLWQIGAINAETIAGKENLPKPTDGSGKTYYRPLNYGKAIAPGETATPKAQSLTDVVDAVGSLIRAGFDPEAVLRALNQPAIEHTGLEPITVAELGASRNGAGARQIPPGSG